MWSSKRPSGAIVGYRELYGSENHYKYLSMCPKNIQEGFPLIFFSFEAFTLHIIIYPEVKIHMSDTPHNSEIFSQV